MSRLSLRARLTILYGMLSLLAGAVILTLLYLVVQARLDARLAGDSDSRIAALRQKAGQSREATITTPNGNRISLDELVDQIRDNEEKIRNAALDTLLVPGSGIVLVISLATAGTGWILAGRGLRPLQTITIAAGQIARSTAPSAIWADASGSPGPATTSNGSPTPSTPCSSPSTAHSTANAVSSRAPPTSFAPRSHSNEP